MAKRKTFIEEFLKPIFAVLVLLLIPVYLKDRHQFWAYVVLGTIVCLAIAFLYIVYQRKQRSHFFQNQDTLDKLRSLTPNQFESFIADLFQRLGYNTERVGGSYDGGIDVIATKDGVKHYIQCKKFITRQVSIHDVRDFYGALADKLFNAKAYFITTNVFTLESEKFCENKPIELIDGKKLMDYVRQAGVPAVTGNQTERCPRCSMSLVEKNGKYGPFLGCSNYPTCTFTKSQK